MVGWDRNGSQPRGRHPEATDCGRLSGVVTLRMQNHEVGGPPVGLGSSSWHITLGSPSRFCSPPWDGVGSGQIKRAHCAGPLPLGSAGALGKLGAQPKTSLYSLWHAGRRERHFAFPRSLQPGQVISWPVQPWSTAPARIFLCRNPGPHLQACDWTGCGCRCPVGP